MYRHFRILQDEELKELSYQINKATLVNYHIDGKFLFLNNKYYIFNPDFVITDENGALFTRDNPGDIVALFECGGGKTNTGHATCWAWQDGNPMKPFCKYKKAFQGCCFLIPFSKMSQVISCDTFIFKRILSVVVTRYIPETDIIRKEVLENYEYHDNISTEKINMNSPYENLIKAAIKRVQHYHPRGIYFFKQQLQQKEV